MGDVEAALTPFFSSGGANPPVKTGYADRKGFAEPAESSGWPGREGPSSGPARGVPFAPDLVEVGEEFALETAASEEKGLAACSCGVVIADPGLEAKEGVHQ